MLSYRSIQLAWLGLLLSSCAIQPDRPPTHSTPPAVANDDFVTITPTVVRPGWLDEPKRPCSEDQAAMLIAADRGAGQSGSQSSRFLLSLSAW